LVAPVPPLRGSTRPTAARRERSGRSGRDDRLREERSPFGDAQGRQEWPRHRTTQEHRLKPMLLGAAGAGRGAVWYDLEFDSGEKPFLGKSKQSLTVIPLGGLGEFGMNMMVFRFGDDILVVDAGMMFPESELLGVDLVIPDISYLKQNRDKVRAIVLTHGHEDHIGALPYILRDLNVPIYGSRFTLALVKKRLAEAGLLDSAKLYEAVPGRLVELGPFEVEFIPVTHSTIDCVALAIRTPVGVVIHSGDFKIDQTPVGGAPFDLHSFAKYGTEGVLALFSDSTNVERPGFTRSSKRKSKNEMVVRIKKNLLKTFKKD